MDRSRIVSRRAGSRKQTRKTPARNGAATLDRLEPRRLLAAVSWDGGGDGVNWTDANNWSTNALPGPGDDVTIDVAGSPNVRLQAGTQSIRSLTCAESFELGFGELSLATASTITGPFTFGFGTLSGAGDLTLAGNSNWNGGSMRGTGRTIVAAGQTMTLGGGSAKQLSRRLDIAGTASLTGNAIKFGDELGADGTLTVLAGGTFNFVGNIFLTSDNLPGHAIVNNGTINRTGAGTTTTLQAGNVTLTNNGTLNVTEGTLDLSAVALVNNGTFTTSAGAVVRTFSGGTYNAGSTFGGAGDFLVQGNATQQTFAPGTFGLTGTVTITNGSPRFDFVGDVTLSSLTFGGGTITGAGDVTVTGALNWSQGSFSGTGTTIVPAGATMTMTGNGAKQIARRIDVAGAATYSGESMRFGLGNGEPDNGTLTILASGTFDFTAGQAVLSFGGTAHQLNNFGTITRTGAGTSQVAVSTLTITNHGAINVNAGTLDLGSLTLVNNGTINVAAAATLKTVNGTSTYNPGSTLAGTGALLFQAGGTHTFAPGTFAFTGPLTLNNGAATVNFNGDVTLPAVTQAGGHIGGSGVVTVDGPYDWTQGDMIGSGRTVVPLGRSITLSGSGAKRVARRVDVAGVADYTGQSLTFGTVAGTTGTLNVLAGGTFNIVGDADLFGFDGTGHQFNNAGTVNRSGGGSTGFSSNQMTFNNTGTVNVNDGTLIVGSSNAGSGAFLSGGRYVVVPGATLDFASGNSLSTLTADIEFSTTGAVPDLATVKVNRGRIGLEAGADLTVTPGNGDPHTLEGILDLSPGSLFTVNGSMNFAGTSQPIVRAEIASSASMGRVNVTGGLNLNSPDSTSRFDPDLVSGFDPPTGSRFDVITASNITNAFDTFFGGVTPSNLVLLLTRPDAATVAVEIGTGTPPPAPRILSSAFEFEAREALVFTFDQNVSAFLSRKDYRIENLATGQLLPQTVGLLSYNAASNQATLLLTHQLPDANYRLTIQASDLANGAGVPATNGITLDFHVLKGDANRDRRVNLADFNVLASNFGQSNRIFSQGDFNYDGTVNLSDFNLLAARFGTVLGAAGAAAPAGQRRVIDELAI
jgi:hypothetical protein